MRTCRNAGTLSNSQANAFHPFWPASRQQNGRHMHGDCTFQTEKGRCGKEASTWLFRVCVFVCFVFGLFPRRKHTDTEPRVEPVLQSFSEEAIRLKPPSSSYQNIDHYPTPALGQTAETGTPGIGTERVEAFLRCCSQVFLKRQSVSLNPKCTVRSHRMP